jgi:hypothetical protein
MLRPYDKFTEAERRTIMRWHLGVAAFYGAIFLVLLLLAVTNHELGRKAASAVTFTGGIDVQRH